MKIDTNAVINSLPIMGVGLLGIFIVTIVIILGIYLLKALTSKSAIAAETKAEDKTKTEKSDDDNKNTTMDLLKEKEKKDFLETEESYFISRDL